MRRAAFAVVTGLMLVAILAPAVSAARPAPTFVAKSSAAAPGGALHLMAKVKHAVRGTDFSATATVHFANGADVTIDLKRHGRSFVAGGRVPVPADQPLGEVAVDVTITYGGEPTAVPTFMAKIELEDESDEDSDE